MTALGTTIRRFLSYFCHSLYARKEVHRVIIAIRVKIYRHQWYCYKAWHRSQKRRLSLVTAWWSDTNYWLKSPIISALRCHYASAFKSILYVQEWISKCFGDHVINVAGFHLWTDLSDTIIRINNLIRLRSKHVLFFISSISWSTIVYRTRFFFSVYTVIFCGFYI